MRLSFTMNKEDFSVLEEIYENCIKEKKHIEESLQNLQNKKEEMHVHLLSLKESEDSDAKFFSPRSLDEINKDEIEQTNSIIEEIDNDIYVHQNRIIDLTGQISKLSRLVKSEDNDYKHLKVLDIQEKERSRVARELHDSSLQNLTHLVHTIELSSMFIDQDPIRAKLELMSCSKNLKQIIDDIRDTIFDLRPMSFDDLGFRQCIENFIDGLKRQYKNCEIIYELDEIEFCESDDEKLKEEYSLFLMTLYRIIQEAVTNALKHAEADKVEFYIKKEIDNLHISIIDNGKGFDVKSVMDNPGRHFGLSIMQERISLLSGKIKFDSELGAGTKIEISVPIP